MFWRALPNRGFGMKGKDCRGGKKKSVAFFLLLLLAQKRSQLLCGDLKIHDV